VEAEVWWMQACELGAQFDKEKVATNTGKMDNKEEGI